MSIDFNIDKIENYECEFKNTEVQMTSKKGEEFTFYLREIDPLDFFECQKELADFKLVDKNGNAITDVSQAKNAKVDTDIRKQMEFAIKMFCMALVDKEGNKIGHEEKIKKFLMTSFDIGELTKVLHVILDITGLSKKAEIEIAKN
jgi:hypothetical protein